MEREREEKRVVRVRGSRAVTAVAEKGVASRTLRLRLDSANSEEKSAVVSSSSEHSLIAVVRVTGRSTYKETTDDN